MKSFYRFAAAVILFLCCVDMEVNAQDTLYTKTGEVRIVKLREIGLDEIKYIPFGITDGPTVVILKSDVWKIRMENGEVMKFQEDPLEITLNYEAAKKTRVIKFEFFSPLTNDVCLGYEQLIRKGQSIEAKIAIIGPGVSSTQKPAKGMFVKVGPKFMSTPEFYSKGIKRTHPLRGGYIKPSFTYSHFSQVYDYSYGYYFNPFGNNTNGTTTSIKETYNNFAIELIFGKQHVLGDVMTIDYYVGFGFGWQNKKTDADPAIIYDLDFQSYAYSHVFLGNSFPLTLSGGITVGYLFK